VSRRTADSFRWNGEHYRTCFAWSFDLSPWIERDDARSALTSRIEGFQPEDFSKVEHFLEYDGNDLAFVEISKEISWDGWEELATNIKQTIRQQGFTGIISVQPSQTETVRVHKNTPWANFMHARTTFMLCCLSTFGLFVYLPYTWLRSRKVAVSSQHSVRISIAEYWPFIADKLNVENLLDNQAPTTQRSLSPLRVLESRLSSRSTIGMPVIDARYH